MSSIKEATFYKPAQSKECPEGYKGRIGIFEVLSVSEAIKEMILRKENADHIQEEAQKEGMTLMVEDGLIKAMQGITSIEEVLRVTTE